MKLPSIEKILSQVREALFRFPEVFVMAFLGTCLALWRIDHDGQSTFVDSLLIVSVLSFFVGIAMHLFAERRGYRKIYASLLTLVFATCYYFILPNGFENYKEIDGIQNFLLGFVFVMLIMVAPCIGEGKINGFWQFNKKLIMRLFFVGVSTGTLFVGIALSIASLDFLFGLDINEEWYFRTFIMVLGLVSTTVLMTGIPKEIESLDQLDEYPKVIEIFSSYVLVPLISLYALILYLYGGKIILTRQWPEGNVSFLILMYATIGIITMLLLYPRRASAEWTKKLSTIFYAALLPLIVLLFLAVYLRISEYGLTEARFAILVLGAWLIGLSFYFIFRKEYNIKYIFVSLIIITLVFSFGPLSAFALSKRNQIARLETVLKKNQILVNGQIKKVDTTTVSQPDVAMISSTIDYLSDVDGLKDIRPWFGDANIEKLGQHSYDNTGMIMQLMGLRYISRWDYESEDTNSHYFSVEERSFYRIQGFEYFYEFSCYDIYGSCQEDYSADSSHSISFNKQNNSLEIRTKNGESLGHIELEELADQLIEAYVDGSVPNEKMILTVPLEAGTAQIHLTVLSIEQENGKIKIESLDGVLLLDTEK